MMSFKYLPIFIPCVIILAGCLNREPDGEQLIVNHLARSLTYHDSTQSYRLAGQMQGDDGQVVEILVHIKGPDHVRVNMRHPDSTNAFFEGWTNGVQAWSNGELCTRCMEGDRTFDALNPVFKLVMGDQVLLNSSSTFAYAGSVDIEGKTLTQVDLPADSVRVFLDANTGLVHQIEGGEVQVVRFKDYRDVGNNRMLPYRIEGDYDGTFLEIDLREVQLDELPAALFEIPN